MAQFCLGISTDNVEVSAQLTPFIDLLFCTQRLHSRYEDRSMDSQSMFTAGPESIKEIKISQKLFVLTS